MNDQQNVSQHILRPHDVLYYTGLISMVLKPGQVAAKFKPTQTSIFLNFLKTVSLHKNQCFMNDQLLGGKC